MRSRGCVAVRCTSWWPRGWLVGVLLAGLLGCAPPAQPARSAQPAAPPPATARSSPPAGQPPSGASDPAPEPLAFSTTPATLKVGTLALTLFAPIFIAQERGYFQELGLRVEEEPFSNATEMRPALVSGQIHVAGGGLSVGTMNALSREVDVKVVADMESARNARESADALVVRKELWDRGTIRHPKDIEGHEIYAPGGIGSGIHIALLRWAEREQIDPSRLTMTQMGTTEIRLALANGAVDVGHLSEPNVAAAVEAGQAEVLAWIGEMYPGQNQLVLLYNVKAIEQAGDRAGERFMVAYLRAARDYVDAFFQGKGTESVIDVLVKNTLIKDRDIYSRAHMHWVDPNGRVNMADLASDVQLLVRAGVVQEPPNLSQAHEPKYAEFATRYLGEYRAEP